MTVLGSGIHFQNICHPRQILLSKCCTFEIKLFLKNYTYTDGWSLVNTIENAWPVVTQLSAVLMVTDGHTLHIPTIQPIGKTDSLPNILYPVLVAITFSLSLSNACSRDSEQSLLTVLTAGGLRLPLTTDAFAYVKSVQISTCRALVTALLRANITAHLAIDRLTVMAHHSLMLVTSASFYNSPFRCKTRSAALLWDQSEEQPYMYIRNLFYKHAQKAVWQKKKSNMIFFAKRHSKAFPVFCFSLLSA